MHIQNSHLINVNLLTSGIVKILRERLCIVTKTGYTDGFIKTFDNIIFARKRKDQYRVISTSVLIYHLYIYFFFSISYILHYIVHSLCLLSETCCTMFIVDQNKFSFTLVTRVPCRISE